MPAKRGRGRPTKCTPARIRAVEAAMETGATWAMAASAARIDRATLKKWLARGRRGEAPFTRMLARATIASAKGGVECLKGLHTKATFLPSAWKLERRFGYTRDGKLSRTQLVWTNADAWAGGTDIATSPTKTQAKKIEASLILGATFEMAGGSAGVGEPELRGWWARGWAGEAPYKAFVHRSLIASQKGGVKCLVDIDVKGKFIPNAWLLERRFAYTWGGELAESEAKWTEPGADGSAAVEKEALRMIRGGREVA